MADSTKSEKIVFPGADGSKLAATLELPINPPLVYALFAHCFTCSKESLAAFRISKALTQFGIAVLRFDFTGLGGSEGDFANTNFSSNIADLVKAADFLRANYEAPQLLIGHSLGGAAVLAAVDQIKEAKAVATIGAPADIEHLKQLFETNLATLKDKGEALVNIGGRTFRIKNQFIQDLAKHKLLDQMAKLDKALLLFHSKDDEIVSIDNAFKLFASAKQNKSFISLDGADHLLKSKDDAFYVANVLSVWVSRYIPLQTNINPVVDDSSQVVVTGNKEDHYTQMISASGHHFFADEPLDDGGRNKGPNPYAYLLSALGACKAITMRMYADLKGIPLDKTVIKLNHSKVHTQDCQDCESNKTKIDQINLEIELYGSHLTDEDRKKLFEIAGKCPVHKTLTSKILIESVLAGFK